MGGEPISAEKVLEFLEGIHRKLDDGFKGVYKEIGTIRTDAQVRQIGCYDRFNAIELSIKTKEAANGVREKHECEKIKFWTPIKTTIIAGLSLSVIACLTGIVWKIVQVSAALAQMGMIK